MIRCALLAALLLVGAGPALAQLQRNFPPTALRGELLIVQPPEARLNGKPARLAPGVRIRGENNLLVMSAALVEREVLVHYTLDDLGLVKDVWLLTEAERAKRPWPTRIEDSKAWRFDPVGQTWSRP